MCVKAWIPFIDPPYDYLVVQWIPWRRLREYVTDQQPDSFAWSRQGPG